MARTKPTEAEEKILKAGDIRRRHLESNPEFQRDLAELEPIAKRLAAAPRSLHFLRSVARSLFVSTAEL